ncbi:MAG: ABC transporter ATP-binding protein, partial [Clostridia bacterium]|nr:ABC transporter ATP-binding protein [Clostridia bacterium]
MAMELTFLTNQRLDEKQATALQAESKTDDPILFSIIGEIAKNDRYRLTALAVTATRLFTFDFETQTVSDSIAFSDMADIFTKRMYGNGLLRVKLQDGSVRDVFRFTFTVAGLCDAAIAFVQGVRKGESAEEEMEAIRGAYDKLLSVCPKCGRTLSAPGVPCIGCMNKGKLFKRLGGYMKTETPILIVSVILSIITTALALMPPLLTKSLVDDILPSFDRTALLIVSLSLIGIHVFRFLLAGIRGYLLRISGNRIVANIRCDVYEKAQHLPMRFYDKTSTGAVINRISGDTATLQAFMLRITQEVVVQAFKLVGIIVVMLIMNPKLTLLSLCPVPIVVIGSRIFRKKIAPFYRRIWRRSSSVTSVLTDTIPGIRVIKSFTNEKNTTKRFSDTVEEWRETDTKAGKILNAYPAIVNALISCGTVVIWSFGGGMVIQNLQSGNMTGLTIGLLVSFISYASMFYEPVNFFANFSDSTQSAMASAERIMDILDAEPEHDFGKGNTDANIGGRIEFKHVNFSFDRTKQVLKDINLVIEPGDVVGIVGTTGSGKSTLINLLLRYYDHYNGEITIDGVDIRNIDMQYYRSRIGYVQQEPMMFHDTIYNNSSYGDDSFSVDEV